MAKFKPQDHIKDSADNVALVIAVDVISHKYLIEMIQVGAQSAGQLTVGQRLEQSIMLIDEICEVWFWKFKPESQTETMPEPEQERAPILTMRDAYLFEHESKKPKYVGTALAWYREGRCPQCGELGRYHLSTAVCSKHGVY